MKFGDIPRAPAQKRDKTLSIVLPGIDGANDVTVRPLSALEDAQAIQFALFDAKMKGSTEPKDGDPLYDAALWAATVAYAYGDADDKAGGAERARFFDSPEQVLKDLPTESIAYLYSEQQRWSEQVSPSLKARSAGELVDMVRKLAELDGDVFFSRCSPHTQINLALFMAARLATLPDSSLPTGLLSEPSFTTASEPKQSAPKRSRNRNRKSETH